MPDFDPFVGSAIQTMRRKAICVVIVNDIDVTNRLDPHLLSVEVCEKSNGEDDYCTIELDDRDARLDIPSLDAPLQIWFGWTSESTLNVFTGNVTEVESAFGRKDGGRRLYIQGRGRNAFGAAKDMVLQHWGEGQKEDGTEGTGIALSQVLQDAFAHAGMSINVHGQLADLKRDYWLQMNESAPHFATRIAKEVGGLFKIAGGVAAFTIPGQNADGSAVATIPAVWGVNLISWRIIPFVARSTWAQANTDYYDVLKSQWQRISKGLGGSNPFSQVSSIMQLPAPAPNASVGGQQNNGTAVTNDLNRSRGWVIINGEPAATPGASLVVRGARPGVDGTYFIDTVEHTYSRQGYVTRCELAMGSPDESEQGGFQEPAGTPAPAPNTVTITDPNGTTTLHPDGSEDWTPAPGASGSPVAPGTWATDAAGNKTMTDANGTTVIRPDGSESWTPAPKPGATGSW